MWRSYVTMAGLNLQRIVCSLLVDALFLVSADGRKETSAMLAGNIQFHAAWAPWSVWEYNDRTE